MGFNEARAASPGIREKNGVDPAADTASMRPGQQAPESSSAGVMRGGQLLELQ